MGLTFQDGVTVLQLIVYIPLFAIACYLWKRDGFGPGSGAWRFATSFCCLRLSGSICSLIAINNPSEGLLTTILISDVVGIQPLILSLIAMTARINYKTNIVPKFVYVSVSVISLAGLALGIYGADTLLKGSTTGSVIKPNAWLQAAMAIFVFLYASLIGLVVLFARRWKSYSDPVDRRVVTALVLASFFLGVKHLDAVLWEFGNSPIFGITGGSTTAWFLMNVLMEMLTIGINLGFGITYGRPEKIVDESDADIESGIASEQSSVREPTQVDSCTDIVLKDEKIGTSLEKI